MAWDGITSRTERERATVRACLSKLDTLLTGLSPEEEAERVWMFRKEAHALLDAALASPRWTRRPPETHALLDKALATPRAQREWVLARHREEEPVEWCAACGSMLWPESVKPCQRCAVGALPSRHD